MDSNSNTELWLDNVVQRFSKFSDEEKNKLFERLIENSSSTQIAFLEQTFKKYKHKDFITLLPKYAAEMLLSYLDLTSLCRIREVSYNWKSVIDSSNWTWRIKCQQLGLNLQSPKLQRALDDRNENYQSLCIRMKKIFREMENGNGIQVERIGDQPRIAAIAMHKNTLISCKHDNVITVWDILSGQKIKETNVDCDYISSAKLAENLVFLGTTDGHLVVLDVSTLAVNHRFSRHSGAIYSIAHDESRGLILTGSTDLTVKTWSLITTNLISTFINHTNWIFQVSVAASDPRSTSVIVASAEHQLILVWDLNSHEILATIPTDTGTSHHYLNNNYLWYMKSYENLSVMLCKYDLSSKSTYCYPCFIGRNVRRLLSVTVKYALIFEFNGESSLMTLHELCSMRVLTSWKILEFRLPCSPTNRQIAVNRMEWMQGFDGFNHQGVIGALSTLNNIFIIKWVSGL